MVTREQYITVFRAVAVLLQAAADYAEMPGSDGVKAAECMAEINTVLATVGLELVG